MVEFQWICQIDRFVDLNGLSKKLSPEFFRVTALLTSKIMNSLSLEKMLTRRPEVFDPLNLLDFSAMGFQMWPGYQYRLLERDAGTFMNIRAIHQVIRMENVLEKLLIIRELALEENIDYQEEILKVFKGVKVVSK